MGANASVFVATTALSPGSSANVTRQLTRVAVTRGEVLWRAEGDQQWKRLDSAPGPSLNAASTARKQAIEAEIAAKLESLMDVQLVLKFVRLMQMAQGWMVFVKVSGTDPGAMANAIAVVRDMHRGGSVPTFYRKWEDAFQPRPNLAPEKDLLPSTHRYFITYDVEDKFVTEGGVVRVPPSVGGSVEAAAADILPVNATVRRLQPKSTSADAAAEERARDILEVTAIKPQFQALVGVFADPASGGLKRIPEVQKLPAYQALLTDRTLGFVVPQAEFANSIVYAPHLFGTPEGALPSLASLEAKVAALTGAVATSSEALAKAQADMAVAIADLNSVAASVDIGQEQILATRDDDLRAIIKEVVAKAGVQTNADGTALPPLPDTADTAMLRARAEVTEQMRELAENHARAAAETVARMEAQVAALVARLETVTTAKAKAADPKTDDSATHVVVDTATATVKPPETTGPKASSSESPSAPPPPPPPPLGSAGAGDDSGSGSGSSGGSGSAAYSAVGANPDAYPDIEPFYMDGITKIPLELEDGRYRDPEGVAYVLYSNDEKPPTWITEELAKELIAEKETAAKAGAARFAVVGEVILKRTQMLLKKHIEGQPDVTAALDKFLEDGRITVDGLQAALADDKAVITRAQAQPAIDWYTKKTIMAELPLKGVANAVNRPGAKLTKDDIIRAVREGIYTKAWQVKGVLDEEEFVALRPVPATGKAFFGASTAATFLAVRADTAAIAGAARDYELVIATHPRTGAGANADDVVVRSFQGALDLQRGVPWPAELDLRAPMRLLQSALIHAPSDRLSVAQFRQLAAVIPRVVSALAVSGIDFTQPLAELPASTVEKTKDIIGDAMFAMAFGLTSDAIAEMLEFADYFNIFRATDAISVVPRARPRTALVPSVMEEYLAELQSFLGTAPGSRVFLSARTIADIWDRAQFAANLLPEAMAAPVLKGIAGLKAEVLHKLPELNDLKLEAIETRAHYLGRTAKMNTLINGYPRGTPAAGIPGVADLREEIEGLLNEELALTKALHKEVGTLVQTFRRFSNKVDDAQTQVREKINGIEDGAFNLFGYSTFEALVQAIADADEGVERVLVDMALFASALVVHGHAYVAAARALEGHSDAADVFAEWQHYYAGAQEPPMQAVLVITLDTPRPNPEQDTQAAYLRIANRLFRGHNISASTVIVQEADRVLYQF